MVGLGGLEPPTSRLSSARSNQLSYKPAPETENPKTLENRKTVRPLSSGFPASKPGSSFGEEREAKTAASRQCAPDWSA
jgi:hypothetical protein